MWNIVASIQHTLDEAAGLSEQPLARSCPVSPTIETAEDGIRVAAEHQEDAPSDVDKGIHRIDDDGVGVEAEEHVPSLAEESACCERSAPNEGAIEIERPTSGDCTDNDPHLERTGLQIKSSSPPKVPSSVSLTGDHDQPRVSTVEPLHRASPSREPAVAPSMTRAAIATSHHRARAVAVQTAAAHTDIVLEKKCQLLTATIESLKGEGQALAVQLGTERERSKHLLQEKRAAEARTSELQELVDAHAAKEKRWEAAKQAFHAGEISQREKVSALESAMLRQADDFRRLSEDSGHSDEKWRVAEASLLAANQSLEEQLTVAHQEHKEEIEQLQEELRTLRHNHRQALSELEHQMASERRELAAATQRAHLAENQLLDDQCSVSASMQELSTQVEQSQHQIGALQKQLSAKQQELAEAQLSTRLAQGQLAEVEDRCEQRVKAAMIDKRHLQKELQQSVEAIERHRTRCDELLRINEELHRTVAGFTTELSALDDKKKPLSTPSTEVVASATSVAAPRESVAPCSPVPSPVRAVPQQSASCGPTQQLSSASQRMEREIARLTKEVRRLKGSEEACSRYKAQLDDLLKQHDMLLQMYGQLEEELSDAVHDSKAVKRVFQDQLDLMALEVERLTARPVTTNV